MQPLWIVVAAAVALAGAAAGCGRSSDAEAHAPPRSSVVSDTSLRLKGSDPLLKRAAEALAAERHWEAARTLDPLLADSSRRTPEAVLLSAAAAAGWRGWERVQRTLGSEPWLDSLFEGRGRELLARAALARGEDSVALRHAGLAVTAAGGGALRPPRLVLLARALDRLALSDSAAAVYREAADELPAIADWLRLRSAGVTREAGRRARDYDDIELEVARARVAPTEAQSLERWGDLPAAAEAYAKLGEPVTALRLRLTADSSEATRAAARRELVAILRTQRGSATARAAVELLDARFAPLAPDEELLVARSLSESGPAARASDAWSRAARTVALSHDDHLAWGLALVRAGRNRDAAARFAAIDASSPHAGRAAYERGRALVRAGSISAGRQALREGAARFPTHPSSASALYLLADLATDDGRDAAARETWRDIVRRFPESPEAPNAAFQAAILSLAAGRVAEAGGELDALVSRYPRADRRLAAEYWAGVARRRQGDDAGARERWRRVVERDPLSYYSLRAAQRLGEPLPIPAEATQPVPVHDDVERAMTRARALAALGMDAEQVLELDELARRAAESPDRLAATGDAFRRGDYPWRAIALGWRMRDSARLDPRAYRAIYPLAYQETIRAESEAVKLDPALVAALIRQESSFNPRARSRADARGVMQLLPGVGRSIAGGLRFPFWDDALLYQPDANIRLGTRHLATLLKTYPALEYALAAYNAGGSRVVRWRKKPGTADPELFVERIPYDETRDYVRILLRNRELYRRLYEW